VPNQKKDEGGVKQAQRSFRIVLIKPSHYDDDGYVIQWYRSAIPSNTLASLYGLVLEAAEAHVLGPDVDIVVDAYDETNTILSIDEMVANIEAADQGVVCLVGVQTNQFPRAVDIGRRLRERGIQVAMGGFHVSGCIAMLRELPADIQEAKDLGISLYAGECEGRFEEFLSDAWNGELKPLYNYMHALPDIADTSIPILSEREIRRTAGHYTSFDSGRGCPFQCSFCTIINVQGRISRRRTPDSIEKIIRANEAQGIKRYFVTDDNFARNKDWESVLDRMIHLKETEKLKFKFIIQVDTLCHRIPNFIEKSVRAGAHRIFIGLESINPDSLMGAKKRQNKIWEYRKMLQMWKERGAMTYAGYILGFPGDTPESIKRDIEIIKKELPLDLVEFFILTPLPGSEDHKVLHEKGVWMDPDMNKYDLNHITAHHDTMSDDELWQAYLDAWKQYYTDEHAETIMRRAVACGLKAEKLVLPLTWFRGALEIEGIHPLELGWLRYKVRTDRRPTLSRENPLLFYPKRAWEFAAHHARWIKIFWKYQRRAKAIEADPDKLLYNDLAIEPVHEDEEESLEMMQVHAHRIQDPRKLKEMQKAS
jgi:hypothetical protein